MRSKIKVAISLIVITLTIFLLPIKANGVENHYAHVYENGICSCGEYEVPESKDLFFQIDNAGKYLWVVKLINSDGTYQNCNIKINADLDFSGIQFVPINTFSGVFDGGGHRFKNINYTASSNASVIINAKGDNVVVKNLIIDKTSSFTTIGWYAGIISKVNSNCTLTMDKCGFEGTVSSTVAIDRCYVGSFIGDIVDGANVSITNSYFSGTVSSNINTFVGLLIGHMTSYSNSIRVSINNCYLNGNYTYSKLPSNIIWNNNISNLTTTNVYLTSKYAAPNNIISATPSMFESGEVAYKLGEAFGQEIGVDLNPILNGKKVYYGAESCSELEYSNTPHQTNGWLVNEDNSGHYQYCSRCESNVYEESHSGTGTCSTLPVCDICNQEFGSLAEHSYQNASYQAREGGHVLVCDYGCNTALEGSLTNHTYEYSSPNNGSHIGLCVCGDEVTEEHSYNDLSCVCGKLLEEENHAYTELNNNQTYHWYECAECGLKELLIAHIYDNLCDIDCNDCGNVREVLPHDYFLASDETYHWHQCRICGSTINQHQHYYDNECDADCNDSTCGNKRIVDEHPYEYFMYDETHIYACPKCGLLVLEEAHNYVNGICVCGHYNVPKLVDNYYQIENAGHLIWFSNYVNSGNSQVNARLLNNIDLKDIAWTPIGTQGGAIGYSQKFSGTFDGNGYEIRNLTLNYSNRVNVGLFGNLTNATVKNLGLVDVNIGNSGYENIGMIAGSAEKSYFLNCYAYGTISTTSNNAGGLAGGYESENLIFENCMTDYHNFCYTSKATFNNCYYKTDFTEEELTNGYATYLLNGKIVNGPWKQTIGTDSYPRLRGDIVYPVYDNCGNVADGYSNTVDNDIPACNFVAGVCKQVEGEYHYKEAFYNTINDYYEIYTAGELMWFAQFVNSGNKNANAILFRDIDLFGYAWNPIAQTTIYANFDSEDLGYSGTFDGNYHIIKNITVTGITDTYLTYGLFGTVSGTVKNLGIENFAFEANGVKDVRVGSVAGQVLSGGKVSNVYVSSSYVNSESFVAGGVVGALYGGEMNNIVVYDVIVTGARTGDVVGDGRGDASNSDRIGTLTNCYSSGSVYSSQAPNATNCRQFTLEEFKLGKVTYIANKDQTDFIWKQTIGTDLFPKFAGDLVYEFYVKCGDTKYYSNNVNDIYTESQDHAYDSDGICYGVSGEVHYQEAPFNSEEGYYEISNPGQFIWFANFVNSSSANRRANAKLFDDIDLDGYGYVYIGSISNRYDGVFDGNNHKININYDVTNEKYLALFPATYSATITNLVVTGSIKATSNSQSYIGGLVAYTSVLVQSNVVTIQNCIVLVDIIADVPSNSQIGGVVGRIGNYHAKYNNIIYKGKIDAPNVSISGGIFGYLAEGMAEDYILMTNILVYLTDSNMMESESSQTFGAGNRIIYNNLYYVNEHNGVLEGAIKVSAEDVENGKLAWLLNNNSSDGVWGQTIGTDLIPNFTGEKVYPVATNCAQTNYSEFSNSFSDNSFEHVFDDDGICRQVDGELHYQSASLNQNDFYEINNAGQLFWFAEFVNSGNLAANAILMSDIDLTDLLWEPINVTNGNTNSTPYTGTFDGNKHVILNLTIKTPHKLDLYNNKLTYGLFGYLGGTVQNLGIENVSFEIPYSMSKTLYFGFIAGMTNSDAVINNCYVANINNFNIALSSYYMGAFVGQSQGAISNSFTYNVTHTGMGGFVGQGLTSTSTFTNNYTTSANFLNSSTLTFNGSLSGVSVDVFSSGEIAYRLNGNVTENSNVWGQIINVAGDPYPKFNNGNNLVNYHQIGGCTDDTVILGYTNNNEKILSHLDDDNDLVCDLCGQKQYISLLSADGTTAYYNSIDEVLDVALKGSVISILGDMEFSVNIPKNYTLVVSKGVTLTTTELVINGTLVLEGNLVGGSLSGNGEFYVSNYQGEITSDNLIVQETYAYQGIELKDTVIEDSSIVVVILDKEFIVNDWEIAIEGSVCDAKTYTITFTSAEETTLSKEFRVTPASLIVKPNDHSIHYGNEASNNGVTYSGFVGLDTEEVLTGELVYAYDYVKGDKAGTYTINVSGLDETNYTFTYEVGQLTVTCGNPHTYNDSYVCIGCEYVCVHPKFTDCECDECGFVHEDHNYVGGYCDLCGYEHPNHIFTDGICNDCGLLETAILITEENYDTFFSNYDQKTYIDYYAITNANNFFWFAQFVNSSTTNSKAKAVLINDIDLANREWTPIGVYNIANKGFGGVIDGNNHEIKNFKISATTPGYYGLVGATFNRPTIKNFTISGQIDVNIPSDLSGNTYIGLVAFSDYYGMVIENVHSKINCKVTSINKTSYISGFVGYTSNNSNSDLVYINLSSYSGTVDLGDAIIGALGGFVGYTYYRPQNDASQRISGIDVQNSIFNGKFISTSEEANYIGGFVGVGLGEKININSCLSLGTFEVTNTQLTGGIAGQIRDHNAALSKIQNNYTNYVKAYGNNDTLDNEISDNAETNETTCTVASTELLASGEVAYKLGNAFGQKLGIDLYPTFVTDDNVLYHGYKTCESEMISYSNKPDELSLDPFNHKYNLGVITKNPTCYSTGVKLYTCEYCSGTYSDTIEKVDHVFKSEWSFNETHHWRECSEVKCEAFEQKEHTFSKEWSFNETHHWLETTCEEHEAIKVSEEMHKWDMGEVETEATCEKEGNRVYTCETCYSTKEESITKLDHTFSEEWSSDDDYHWHMATCEHSNQIKDNAEHTFDSGKVTKEPTYDEEGVKLYTCNECGKTKEEKIGILTHQHSYNDTYSYDKTYHWYSATCEHINEKDAYAEHNFDWTEFSKATCEQAQVLIGVCSICEYETKKDGIEALGHDYGELVAEVEATCTDSGVKAYYTCSVCEKHFDEEKVELTDTIIQPLGHEYGELIKKVAPTCTNNGTLTHYTCSVCGKNFDESKVEIDDITIEALGHDYGELIAKVDARCEITGKQAHYTCSVCQKYFNENKVEIMNITIEALGHDYGELVAEVEATCETAGKQAHYMCSVCQTYFNENKVEIADITIEALGHTPVDSTSCSLNQSCRVCGEKIEENDSTQIIHQYGVKYDDNNHWNECSCGDKKDVEAHIYNWVVTKEATEDNEGLKQGTCECGHVINDTIEKLQKSGLSVGAIVTICIAAVIASGITVFAVIWFVIKKNDPKALINNIKHFLNKK